MHDDRSLIERRLFRVARDRIDTALTGASHPLTVEAWEVPGEPVPVAQAAAAAFEPFQIGSMFGRPWGTTWFRMTGTVPADWAGRTVLAAINLGFGHSPGFQSEGLVWVRDGDDWVPWRGLHPLNHHLPIGAPAQGGETVDWLVEAASNPEISIYGDPNSDITTARTGPIYNLRKAAFVESHTDVVALREDIRAIDGLRKQLPDDQPRSHEILRALEDMLDTLDLDDVPGSAGQARECLAEVLSRPAHASAHQISAIGHAHIDSAWLWPLRETRRKCSRTFSNVLALMDEDPEFMFGCSQAVQYDWMREGFPTIFQGIKDKVAGGQWVPVGGMWVEADTNLAGGEALIRQITHGQRFFEEHFGVECTEVWIPDVFGYPASLPGIMAACGIDRFLTQKLSWNRTNRFPHHSFWWEGIDGSTVFTHFPPVETYNSTVDAHELAHAVRTFTDKGRANRSLLPFGYGDGGGGPTARMLGQYHRAKDLEGSPKLQIEAPSAFFDKAIEEYTDAPRWVGELYFEMHRGTFTSQAATKAGNRRCEARLREAEAWVVAAHGTDAAAPQVMERLDALWKDVLLLQFHDILPGSSIGWVHREAAETYERVEVELEEIIGDAVRAVAGPGTDSVTYVNPAPVPYCGVAVTEVVDAEGQQFTYGGTAQWVDACPMSVTLPSADLPAGVAPVTSTDGSDGVVLDNGLVRVVIDGNGHVASLVDLTTGREAVAPGQVAGVLQLHPDLPVEYDAWDIEDFDVRRPTPVTQTDEVTLLDAGPMMGRVRVSRTEGPSRFEQTYELAAGTKRLDVRCYVEWGHRERLLKVAFPLDLHTDQVTREIQFGQLTTPIHTNTSWDTARFEFCAHRWVHVTEPGFGVAVLNDCKYGYDAQRTRSSLADGTEVPTTTVRLSLLKAAVWPDPVQDEGEHTFTYSLLVGDGRLDDGVVVAEGYRLNQPPRQLHIGATGERSPLAPPTGTPVVASDSPTVVVEAVKPADDGSGDVVVRCYESAGGRARTTLRLGFAATAARTTDARERDLPGHSDAPVVDGTVAVELRPFEVRTLRITR